MYSFPVLFLCFYTEDSNPVKWLSRLNYACSGTECSSRSCRCDSKAEQTKDMQFLFPVIPKTFAGRQLAANRVTLQNECFCHSERCWTPAPVRVCKLSKMKTSARKLMWLVGNLSCMASRRLLSYAVCLWLNTDVGALCKSDAKARKQGPVSARNPRYSGR